MFVQNSVNHEYYFLLMGLPQKVISKFPDFSMIRSDYSQAYRCNFINFFFLHHFSNLQSHS